MSDKEKPHWFDKLEGLSAGIGVLVAGWVASLPPETRKGFLRALMESYCADCGQERKCSCSAAEKP